MATSTEGGSKLSYDYLPDARTHIRLLQLEPGTDDGVIRCNLVIVRLSDRIRYAALSYTWGGEHDLKEVLVDGCTVSIRLNCHYALWQLRYHDEYQFYWIDSICINQADLEEKSLQVQVMRDIFAGAVQVLASLGPHADDSELVFESAKGFPSHEDHYGQTNHLRQVEQERGSVLLCCARDALERLEERPYWRRLWIVQEFLKARDVTLMCGDSIANWNSLRSLISALSIYLGVISKTVKSEDHEWRNYVLWEMWSTLDLRDAGGDVSLSTALSFFGRRQCSRQLDHIYGLLGVIKAPHGHDGPWITVDYSRSIFSLALELVPFLDRDSSVGNVATLLLTLGLYPSHPVIKKFISQRRLDGLEKAPLQWPRHVIDPISQPVVTRQHCDYISTQVNAYNIGRVLGDESGELTFNMTIASNFRGAVQDLHEQLWPLHGHENTPNRLPMVIGHNKCIGFISSSVQKNDYLVQLDLGWQDRGTLTCLVIRWQRDDLYDLVGHAMFKPWGSFHSSSCRLTKSRKGEELAPLPTLTFRFDSRDLIALAAQFATVAGPHYPRYPVLLPLDVYMDRFDTTITVNKMSFARASKPDIDLLEACDCRDHLPMKTFRIVRQL